MSLQLVAYLLVAAATLQATNASSPILRIALYGGDGAILGDPNFPYQKVLKLAAGALGDYTIDILNKSADVQQKLTRHSFDVVFFPGGSGHGQATGLGEAGLAAVKAFVASGGGYIGTCGGAFLALEYLRLYGDGPKGHGIPAKELGHGNVPIVFTKKGLNDLNLDRQTLGGNVSIHYMGGPVVATDDLPSDVSVLAWYRTDLPQLWSFGSLIGQNTPALTYTEYGSGRVVLNSPHPEHIESEKGIGPAIYRGELAWVSRLDSQTLAMLV